MSETHRRVLVLILAALAYFMAYPDDTQALKMVLDLTSAISPWLYGVVAVGIIALAIVKTLGVRVDTQKSESR